MLPDQAISEFRKAGGKGPVPFSQGQIIADAGDHLVPEDKKGICVLACAAWICHGCPDEQKEVSLLQEAIGKHYIALGSTKSAIEGDEQTVGRGGATEIDIDFKQDPALDLEYSVVQGDGGEKRFTIGKLGAQGTHSIGFYWKQKEEEGNVILKMFDPNEGVFTIEGSKDKVCKIMGDLILYYTIPINFPSQPPSVAVNETRAKLEKSSKGIKERGNDRCVFDDTDSLQLLISKIGPIRQELLVQPTVVVQKDDPFASDYNAAAASSGSTYSPSHPTSPLSAMLTPSMPQSRPSTKGGTPYDPSSPTSDSDKELAAPQAKTPHLSPLQQPLAPQPLRTLSPPTAAASADAMASPKPPKLKKEGGGINRAFLWEVDKLLKPYDKDPVKKTELKKRIIGIYEEKKASEEKIDANAIFKRAEEELEKKHTSTTEISKKGVPMSQAPQAPQPSPFGSPAPKSRKF